MNIDEFIKNLNELFEEGKLDKSKYSNVKSQIETNPMLNLAYLAGKADVYENICGFLLSVLSENIGGNTYNSTYVCDEEGE